MFFIIVWIKFKFRCIFYSKSIIKIKIIKTKLIKFCNASVNTRDTELIIIRNCILVSTENQSMNEYDYFDSTWKVIREYSNTLLVYRVGNT